MTRDKSEIEVGLRKKGFKPTHQGSDHNWFIYVSLEGQKAKGARTKTSHGRGVDLSDGLLAQMARQVGLTKKQFLELVDCPLSRADYEALLRQKGSL